MIGARGGTLGQPNSGGMYHTLANVKSGHTQATNISSNERSSPVMANITDKGLSVVQSENPKKQGGVEQS